ncbi:hypothetical protein U9M48_041627 [Paspalum notatum var. saurae]|uniref:Uncharacterized protein n=1 Tax=Paspalum notatum var. saurae TaxID=547442 RepID=A0AAQ3UP65_PASNO
MATRPRSPRPDACICHRGHLVPALVVCGASSHAGSPVPSICRRGHLIPALIVRGASSCYGRARRHRR